MAFDRNNAADLAALKSEVQTDPAARGYAAVAGDTSALLKLLNEDSGESVQIPTEDLDIPDIAAVIDATEYAALSEYDKEWVRMFINQPVEIQLKQFQTKFLAIFPQGSVTLAAVVALRDRTGSRAEKLFGAGTEINRSQWIAARDS